MKSGFFKRHNGAAKTEYIIMVCLIAIFSIGIVSLYGDNIRALLGSSANALAGDENTVPQTQPGENCHYTLKGIKVCKGGGAGGSNQPGSGSSGSDNSNLGSNSSGLSNSGSPSDGSSKKGSSVNGPEGYGKGKIGEKGKKERAWGNEKEDPNAPKNKKAVDEIGIDIVSWEDKREAQKYGDDNANLRIGALDTELKLGVKYDREKGEFYAGGGASARGTLVEGNLEKTIGDEKNGVYGKGKAQGRFLTGEVNVEANVVRNKDGYAAKLEAGIGGAVAEGKLSGEGGFRIPKWVPVIGGAKVYAGGELSGSVLSAEAKVNATGKFGKGGFELGGGAKVGALLAGAGFKFKVGMSFD